MYENLNVVGFETAFFGNQLCKNNYFHFLAQAGSENNYYKVIQIMHDVEFHSTYKVFKIGWDILNRIS